jgi:enoyl-CoA hydratase/carnithine racemase
MACPLLNEQRRGPVAWVEYDNPPRNAINWEMLDELPAAIRRLDLDPAVRVIVLASRLGGYFSVGADLRLFAGISRAGRLRSDVQDYAVMLDGKPKEAPAAIRKTITLGGGTAFDKGVVLEIESEVELVGTPNFSEGIAAFLARRKPSWQ